MLLVVFTLVCILNVINSAPADLDTILDNVGKNIKYELPDLPVPYIDRSQQTNLIKDLHSNSQKFVVLTGPRGVGKSAIARKYAEDHSGSVLWINSSTMTQMVNEFKTIHTTNIGPIEDKKITAIIRSVIEHFKGKNTLYIFDSANSDNILLTQINNYINKDDPSKVIVTSRNTDWSTIFTKIPVDVFSKDQSINYLQIVFKDLTIPKEDARLAELAQALSYLPLALKKSSDFIIKQNSVSVYTIDDFIYEIKHGKLPSVEQVPDVIQEDPEIDWVGQFAGETGRITSQISDGASEAWEKVSSGATHVGSQISHGAERAGQEISRAAQHVGSEVRRVFSGFG